MARLAPGSLLLLAARSVGVLGELEGELRAAYLELHVQALPADLGADEGLQHVAWDTADALCRHHDGTRLQRLLLLNNAEPSSSRGKSKDCDEAPSNLSWVTQSAGCKNLSKLAEKREKDQKLREV
ncbi:hypothetical protein JRQ81_016300 [Phrynocephalus forsythii]|uniref:Uncharacterized protein n=1 Tax=Phrynocephalus forsythii TaxID=171643 RepID=A0A9Q1B293_9SAUR|nr:hypothetical protein JRQ81_016300 [Phrynocephalus forsythii]